MAYSLFALNHKTGEKILMGDFYSKNEAWDAVENSIEWDPEDNPLDWSFSVEEVDLDLDSL